jgi:hypothetical protein
LTVSIIGSSGAWYEKKTYEFFEDLEEVFHNEKVNLSEENSENQKL